MTYPIQNKNVSELATITITGNVTPQSWYKQITFENGKPNLNAITILSEILYWYRPVSVMDENTKEFVRFDQKFKEKVLQYSYAQFENKFGLSKRQVRDSLVMLEEMGLVKRYVENNVKSKTGMTLNNVMYIDIDIKKINQVTLGLHRSTPTPTEMLPQDSVDVTTNTKTSSEISSENNTTQEKILENDLKARELIELSKPTMVYEMAIANNPNVPESTIREYEQTIALEVIDKSQYKEPHSQTSEFGKKFSSWMRNYIPSKSTKATTTNKPYVAHGNDHKYIKPAVEEITMAQRQNETDDEYEARVNAREADGDVRVKRAYKKSKSAVPRPSLKQIT